ncbi:apolipoprotein N-acyltransferase [Bdellovibrionota bacterium FG-1]
MFVALVRKLKPDWLTLLSAALIVFAFPPWNCAPLIWIALIPWLMALTRAPNHKAAALQGLWLGFATTLGGYYWIAHVLQEFANLPWPLAVLGLLLFGLIAQPQLLLFGPLWRAVRLADAGHAQGAQQSMGRLIFRALGLAALYVGLEWALPKLFTDTLGHSLYRAQYLRQAADLGGAPLLTFVIVLVNESFFRLLSLVRFRKEPSILPVLRIALGPLTISALCVAGLLLYGQWRYHQIASFEQTPRSTLQAGVIQGNIGDFDKVAAERGVTGAAQKVLETYFWLSDQALAMQPKPQVLIWPETSYPSTFRTPQTASEMERDTKVENFAQSRGVPILFGGYDHFEGKDFNAFFFLSPRGARGVNPNEDLQIYRKSMLLMFGEYIPGADTFPWIKTTFPQVGNFGQGVGASVVPVEIPATHQTVRAGPIICYEALFPNYVIQAARKGSQLILNITNDSWFGPYGEPELHLALIAFRSIETRLPQLRSTNTGISALILPNGDITQPTPVGQAKVLNVTVPLLNPIPTLMLAWGDWFGWFALLFAGMALLPLGRVIRKLRKS